VANLKKISCPWAFNTGGIIECLIQD